MRLCPKGCPDADPYRVRAPVVGAIDQEAANP